MEVSVRALAKGVAMAVLGMPLNNGRVLRAEACNLLLGGRDDADLSGLRAKWSSMLVDHGRSPITWRLKSSAWLKQVPL